MKIPHPSGSPLPLREFHQKAPSITERKQSLWQILFFKEEHDTISHPTYCSYSVTRTFFLSKDEMQACVARI